MQRDRAILSPRLSLLLAVLGFVSTASAAQDPAEFFEKKIRPVLVERCYECHSAKSEEVKAALWLDTKAGTLKGGDHGPMIVPGEPDKSRLIEALGYKNEDLQMPPDEKLSDAQLADFVAWVKMGAPDPREDAATSQPVASRFDFPAARKNWAYHVPDDPPAPVVNNKSWAKTDIDRFILAKLEAKNLPPAKQADKRTLIRRATFDLTGLPPTPQEVEAFLADESPDAFAKVVDRLLASPHYGERSARNWLDVVRYTDSFDTRLLANGLPGDNPADAGLAWLYRDWVVSAFNRDLPYDQFVIQQFTGDLLPVPDSKEPTDYPAVATTVFAIGEWGGGDADKEKLVTDMVDDQVDLTGRAFLGMTVACARCHDHKFDPIPTADYYSLAGIFFSSRIVSDVGPKGGSATMIRTPLASPAEIARRKQRDDRMAELDKLIQTAQDARVSALASTALPKTADYLAAAKGMSKESVNSVASEKQLDPIVLARWVDFLRTSDLGLFTNPVPNALGNAGLNVMRNSANADTPAVVANATGADVAFLTIKLPAKRLSIHPSPTAGVAAAWKSPITGQIIVRGRVVDVDSNGGDGIAWQLTHLDSTDAGASESIVAKGDIPDGGQQEFSTGGTPLTIDVKPGQLLQLSVLPKANHSCDSTMIELTLTENAPTARTWNINQDVATDLLSSNPHPDHHGNADVWYFRDLAVGAPKPIVAETIAAGMDDRFVAPRGAFWATIREDAKSYPPDVAASMSGWKSESNQLKANPPPPVPQSNGLQEGGVANGQHPTIGDVKVHIRGRYDRLGDVAPRRFPQLLAGDDQKPITEGSGRLQLAKWIASKENPLTARVMVNRLWQQHFGEGIVRTPNNYGKLGVPPTHPELLDYLAHRFIESGWSVKAMHRAIMLSAVYQQSCTPDAATLAADPDNLLLGRMNRQRLTAEALRDSLLAYAGNLAPQLGGPSFRDLDNPRRTLYLMTVRSDRSGFRPLFDGADSTAIVEQRNVSTVAPQALFLMNDPFTLKQARALTDRVTKMPDKTDDQKITWLYQTLFARVPTPKEIEIGTLAAKGSWEQYCQVLLCANELVYVD